MDGAARLRAALTSPDHQRPLATAAIDAVVDTQAELDRLRLQTSLTTKQSRIAATDAAVSIIAGEPQHAAELIVYLARRLGMVPAEGYTPSTPAQAARINQALQAVHHHVLDAIHTNADGAMDRLTQRARPRPPADAAGQAAAHTTAFPTQTAARPPTPPRPGRAPAVPRSFRDETEHVPVTDSPLGGSPPPTVAGSVLDAFGSPADPRAGWWGSRSRWWATAPTRRGWLERFRERRLYRRPSGM